MVQENRISKMLPIVSIAGLLVAALAGLAEHVPWLESVCMGFSGGCRDTARMTLFHVPLWGWGAAFYALLTFAAFAAAPLVFWLVTCALGVEIVLVWLLISMKVACIFCIANLFVILLAVIAGFEKEKVWKGLSMCLLFILVSGVLIPRENAAPPAAAKEEDTSWMAARVGNETITREMVDAPIAQRIMELQREIYGIERERLDQIIMETILQREARERNVTVDQLLSDNIPRNDLDVTDEEVDRYRQENADRLRDWRGSEEDLRARIKGFLVQQKRFREVARYSKTLEDKYKVSVFLKEPEAMLTRVDVTGSPSVGPPDAPVTVVEFSDYQCPACRQAHDTVLKVREAYKDKVRWYFKDFPLRKHKDARKAAEAARCAAEQNKFWEYQNVLYSSPDELNQDRLERFAQELGLDKDRFTQCLNSEKYKAAVDKDIEDARKAGVDSTPVFIFNGRMMVGGLPLDQFKTIIEEELNKAKVGGGSAVR